MTIKLGALLVTIGSLVFGIGLILGLTSMTQSGSPCGSAFSPNEYTQYDAQCVDALSGRRGIALALTIPGAALAVVGVLVMLGEATEKAKHDVGPEAPTIL